MQIDFTGHGLEVTPALREFTIGKLDKLMRHFDKVISIDVVFNVGKLTQIVKATIHIPRAKFHASSESQDMYAAVDELIRKLDSEISTYKGKIKHHHRE